jgi:hypothetical protein
MTSSKITLVNATTQEQTKRDLNPKELKQFEADNLARDKGYELEAEAKALRDSANSKLAALGLTPEEIAAITA